MRTAGCVRGLDRVGQDGIGANEIASLAEGSREVEEHRAERFRVTCEQCGSSLEEGDRGRDVLACERSAAGGGEEGAGARGEPSRALVLLPELRAQAVRLLEVVRHDLLDLAQPP